MEDNRSLQAFIIGIALGDGNLSNPNGRAVRLRITCDTKYPNIINEVKNTLRILFPLNQVSTTFRTDNCVDISLYSNKLLQLLPWLPDAGSKYDQQARVPVWIFTNKKYVAACLRGLIQSDGSIYTDRGYTMINFCSNIQPLAHDVLKLADILGCTGTITATNQRSGKEKYTIRFSKSKDVRCLLDIIGAEGKS